MNYIRSAFLISTLSLLFVSCGDDPKLVEQREKQKAEIARLKGELALIDEKIKNSPPDVSTELIEVKKTHQERTSRISELENEVTSLEEKKSKLLAEFEAYKLKYKIDQP
jgi:archaellum component FlaC